MRAAMITGALLLCAACTQRPMLEPAAEAMRIPGAGGGAMDVIGDVRVEARAETWDGLPANFDDVVMPLMVRVVNNSDRPLLLRYQDMQLHGGTGMTYLALPPFDLEATEVQQAVRRYPARGFTVAPHLEPWYAGVETWAEPLAWDRMYYDRYQPAIRSGAVPTLDMIDRALPEGVLQPGGEITGFIYMQPIGDVEERVMFEMSLVDARTGLAFGTARIPFQVRMRPAT